MQTLGTLAWLYNVVSNLVLSPKAKPLTDTLPSQSRRRALATGGRPALRSLALARAAPPPSIVATSPLRVAMSR